MRAARRSSTAWAFPSTHVERVIIAGGFGHSIDLEKAQTIGLLPDVAPEKFLFVGNGSLLGARLLSFSRDLLKETERIARTMTNVELSNNPGFMDEFIAALFIPHTNENAFPRVTEQMRNRKGQERIGRLKRPRSPGADTVP